MESHMWWRLTGGVHAALALAPAIATAQQQPDPPGAFETCAGCGACGGGIAGLIAIPIALIAINIALLIWVARDAKARGMDNAVLWMIVVMFLGLIGLVIYLFSRPQGTVVACPSCNNKRLESSARCPHCGNS